MDVEGVSEDPEGTAEDVDTLAWTDISAYMPEGDDRGSERLDVFCPNDICSRISFSDGQRSSATAVLMLDAMVDPW